jgi:hypothetical protein
MEEGAEERGGKEEIYLGKWTIESLERLLLHASEIIDSGNRIAFLSEHFLGTSYKENTLVGGPKTSEALVVKLDEVDCFTYIDYVEAMRLSTTFSEFLKMLRRIRYRAGKVSYFTRNHFFIDWREANRRFTADVTAQVGGVHARTVTKVLNRKEDGAPFLPGVPGCRHRITYIPRSSTGMIMKGLWTGDYGGIYAEVAGLDVSHTGIIIKSGMKTLFRHASSIRGKVVQEELETYLSGKPGLVLLRPRPTDLLRKKS